MIWLGYIDEVIKGASDGIYGKYLTRYRATNKLINLFTEDERKVLPVLMKPEEKTELVRIQVTEKVEQGEGKRPAIIKRLVEYSDNEKTNQMKMNLEKINKVLSWNWFDLDLEDNEFDAMQEELKSEQNKERGSDPQVNLANRSLYRVFTDTSFTRGGRFYGGWWQQIPSQYRGRILINGKKTVEFDYGGLHPNILYAEVGIEMSEDAYNGILPLKYRTIVKKTFNAMLNAKHVLTRPPRDLSLRETGWTWTQLSNAIMEKHQPIQHYFYSDTGTRLQFIDSQLAESIMLKFIDNQAPILPVHDSFLVHNGYESALEQYMKDFFRERFDRNIEVKKQIKMEKPLPEFDPDDPFRGSFVTDDIEELLSLYNIGHERRLNAFRSL